MNGKKAKALRRRSSMGIEVPGNGKAPEIKEKLLFKAIMNKDGNIEVQVANATSTPAQAMISHAYRIVGMEINKNIVVAQMPQQSSLVTPTAVPTNIMDRIKGKK